MQIETLDAQLEWLKPLLRHLQCLPREKQLACMAEFEVVHLFLGSRKRLAKQISTLSPEQQVAIYALIALGQGPYVLEFSDRHISQEDLERLAKILWEVEDFYSSLGGIIGYHVAALELIQGRDLGPLDGRAEVKYSKPPGMDLRDDTDHVRQAVMEGLRQLPHLAEVYAVGGAGDRLDLRTERGDTPLPAARLMFNGRTLLEGLLRDLCAKEYLYYKIFNKQTHLPIILMTSEEKNNHQHVVAICEEKNWFGRPKENFFFVQQPLAPVIAINGRWALKAPFTPSLKPGGHGVIWKLASDTGAFAWLREQHRNAVLVRQINNPIAGIDHGLIAFVGMGFLHRKQFGFASCDRLLNAPEGMDVLVEYPEANAFRYCITNVEYTEFEKRKILDHPSGPNSPYSAFPSNTNILFANLDAIEETLKISCYPGLLINLKSQFPTPDEHGHMTDQPAGRLETTMQNIADYIVDSFPQPLVDNIPQQLSTYVTYNDRHKTLSVTKQTYQSQKGTQGTPVGCFFDLQRNHYDLLTHWCHIKMPELGAPEEFVSNPPFLVQYHPALGPLYTIIAQKIRGGAITRGSELELEITDLDIDNLDLNGSLSIIAETVTGNPYGEQTGKCCLSGVKVHNRGVHLCPENIFWKHTVAHREQLRIRLMGSGEFHAKNVCFEGTWEIVVPNGVKVTASVDDTGKIELISEACPTPSWKWAYEVTATNEIRLKRHELEGR